MQSEAEHNRQDQIREFPGDAVQACSELRHHAGPPRARDLPGDGRSLREIVSTLTAEGHRTKRGGQWYPSTIASLLDTERA